MNNLYFNEQYSNVVADMKGHLTELLITSSRVRTVERTRLKNTKQRKFRYQKGSNSNGKFSILKLQKDERLTLPATEMYLL